MPDKSEQICPHTLPLEGDAQTIVAVYPNAAGDGFTEHPVSSSLSKRHPYLPEHSAVVKADDATVGYGHRAWQRIAEQLKSFPKNGFSLATMNNVLEIAAQECTSDPEWAVEFGLSKVDFNVLLDVKELRRATAKVLDPLLHYKGGREWCASISLGKKLGEIVQSSSGATDEEEKLVLYAIGKACHRWSNSRDETRPTEVVTAIVHLLSNFVARAPESRSSVDWLLILEFYCALKYMSAYCPQPLIDSDLISLTVDFMTSVHKRKAEVPNCDLLLTAAIGPLVQGGNLDSGRTKLVDAHAEKISCLLLFEANEIEVQNAAAELCACICLQGRGKGAIEKFLVPDHLPKLVENLAKHNSSFKTSYIESAAAKPSFRTSFIREAIRQDRIQVLEEIFGANVIPTAFTLLHELPLQVLTCLRHFLTRPNAPDGRPDMISIARLGLPVESPSCIAYENCVDFVEHCSKYYEKHSSVVMEIFRVISKQEPRFRPQFENLPDNMWHLHKYL
ncbi:unnamed protein product [Amoebophrya sp. A25]|nr:unnamed protein product [Amoebophrya sp. A25]|eukprot:GSA25T00004203001.1